MKRYQGSYLSYFFMYMFYYLSMALFSGLISVYLMDKGYKATEVAFDITNQDAVLYDNELKLPKIKIKLSLGDLDIKDFDYLTRTVKVININ